MLYPIPYHPGNQDALPCNKSAANAAVMIIASLLGDLVDVDRHLLRTTTDHVAPVRGMAGTGRFKMPLAVAQLFR